LVFSSNFLKTYIYSQSASKTSFLFHLWFGTSNDMEKKKKYSYWAIKIIKYLASSKGYRSTLATYLVSSPLLFTLTCNKKRHFKKLIGQSLPTYHVSNRRICKWFFGCTEQVSTNGRVLLWEFQAGIPDLSPCPGPMHHALSSMSIKWQTKVLNRWTTEFSKAVDWWLSIFELLVFWP
jgi:hypothetical protein